ncbi:MAG: DNA-binding protein [Thermoproteales archaeon]|nr:DNA-binding protein [Thermoproteales archaeon]RLE65884.1 MAG: DNA-binding protein [Thermoprotei archaeon]
MSRRIGTPFKACRNCKRLVRQNVDKCPDCGSRDLTQEWFGLAIIISDDSLLKQKLELSKTGKYTLKVR